MELYYAAITAVNDRSAHSPTTSRCRCTLSTISAVARAHGQRAETCKQCGKRPPAGERISARNLCSICAHENMAQMRVEYANETGPLFDKWRKSYIDAALRMMEQTA